MDRDSRTFDRDTLLDLTVNLIPLGIMLFFVVVFLFVNPFGEDRTATLIQMTILVLTFLALTVLTYVSGKVISDSEKELEQMDGIVVSEKVGLDQQPSEEPTEGQSEAGSSD